MRLVIDIEGDQVKVHRMDSDEVPPADVLVKAAALNAQSAGMAKFRIPEHAAPGDLVLTQDELSRGASDAGRAPAPPGGGRQPSKARRVPQRASRAKKAPRGR